MTGDDPTAVLCVATGRETGPAQRLTATDADIRTEHVSTPDEALRVLDRTAYDCLLLGDRTDTDIRTALERLTGSHPDIPVLCYGVDGDLSAYLDAGATDIVRGDSCQSDVLVARVRNAVEQYRARRRARERDQQLTSLLEQSSDWLSVLDGNGRYQFVSPAVERGTGHEPEDLLGSSAFENVHAEDRAQDWAACERTLKHPA